ncbi:MAG: PQQ-binding-like beta-propeller repeat protein [bacterium]
MRNSLFFFMVICFGILVGCSSSSSIPTQPNAAELPKAESSSTDTGLLFSGVFDIDLDSMSISQQENRQSEYVYNITGFLPDKCPGGCFRFSIINIVGTVLEIELTIENPLAIQVYDVRILYTNLFGKTVVNPDSYTDFLGTPITNIFPFTAFAKEIGNRAFPTGPGGIDTEILLLDFPPGSPSSVNYAISASLPSNTAEPYEISDMNQTGTLTPSGGSATISCEVSDHQSDITAVYLDSTPFTGGPVVMLPGAQNYNVEISNTVGAPVGIYNQLIMAMSNSPQHINTYNYVVIEVVEDSTGSYWPQFQHDSTHAGLTNVVGPQTNHVEWSYTAPGSNALLCIEGYDGTIYYGTVGNSGRIEAVNPDGTEKWTYTPSVSSPWNKPLGITPDNSVLYVGLSTGSFQGRVAGVNPANGDEIWITSYMYAVSANTYGLILDNGDLVVSGEDAVDYNTKRFDKNGNEVWRVGTGWNWCTAPAQGQDGTIYVKSNPYILGLNPDTGAQEHSVNFGEAGLNTQACLAVRSDGSVIFAGNIGDNTKVWCFDSDLNEQWDFICGTGIPIDGFGIGLNDEIYFTVYGTMFAIAADGSQTLWEYPGAMHWSTPVIDPEGTIYCGTQNGIDAVNPDGTTRWSFTGPGYAASPVLSHDGFLYANMNGDLFKFADL